MLSVRKAKDMIAIEADRLGCEFRLLSGKLEYFNGSFVPCVTVKEIVSNPAFAELTKFAKTNKIALVIYIDKISE